jgi:hypothetical protein
MLRPGVAPAQLCRRSVRRLGVAATASLLSLMGLVGCGKELTASSTCSDFLSTSPQDQDAAVRKVAARYHAGNALTPVGRPNIDYLCGNHPKMTLGTAIRDTG